MNLLLLIITIMLFVGQSLAVKLVKADTVAQRILVNTAFCAVSAAVMSGLAVFTPLVGSISPATVCLGLVFGLIFMLTMLFYNLAVSCGPLSYTAFYFSSSMLLTAAAGVILFKEPFTASLAGAAVLFMGAFYCLNVDPGQKSKPNPRWLVFCALTLVCNSLLSIVQKYHQQIMEGKQSSGLMLIGFLSAFFFYLISWIVLNRRKPTESAVSEIGVWAVLRKNRIPVCLLALASLGGNLILTWLAGRLASSYVFPLVQGSIILGVSLASVWVFGERLSGRGKFGIALGLAAIVLINL